MSNDIISSLLAFQKRVSANASAILGVQDGGKSREDGGGGGGGEEEVTVSTRPARLVFFLVVVACMHGTLQN